MKIQQLTIPPWIPLVIILVVAAVFRLAYLDRIPTGINGDELGYVVTSKAVAVSGSDLMGKWNPLRALVFQYPQGELQAELPYVFLTPYFSFLPVNLFTARLPYALLSTGVVALIYSLTLRLFGKPYAYVAGLVAAVNPWLVYIGRTNYEAGLALFFYLLVWYLLIVLHGKWIYTVIPVMLAAFYSYIGTKVLFIPFVTLSLCYVYFNSKYRADRKKYLVILGFSLVLVLIYGIILKTNPSVSRLQDITSLKNSGVNQTAFEIRYNMIDYPLNKYFINTSTEYGKYIIDKILQIFSPSYLFMNGDQFISIWIHGLFYRIDFFFLLIGFGALFAEKRREFYYLCSFAFIAILPHLVHHMKENFTPHNTLLIPFFLFIMAYGITWIIMQWKSLVVRWIIGLVIILIYLYFVINYILIYLFTYPVFGNSELHKRIVSRYASIAQTKLLPVTIYSNSEMDMYKKFLLYTNGISPTTIQSIRNSLIQGTYTYGTLIFEACDETIKPNETTMVMIYDNVCGHEPNVQGVKKIKRLSDGGIQYFIYNDPICSKYQLQNNPNNIHVSDLAIESLTEEQFCTKFISN